MKRYKECNWLVKMLRHRHYVKIAFKFVWFNYIADFKVGKDEFIDGKLVHTDEYDVYTGKQLWGLLRGSVCFDMGRYVTQEEMEEHFKKWEKDL